MPRLVSLGECMVELSPTGPEDLLAMSFAGDTYNTAWYLAQLLPADWQVDYVSAVGTDALSSRLLAAMDTAGIGTRHVARLPDRTLGLYLIELADGERSFVYWRGESAARAFAADPARLATALEGAAVAYLSGITLAILSDPDRAQLLAALARFRADGGRIVLDPNLRPRLWPDPATMCAAVTAAAALAQDILPSYEDEAAWFGDASPTATARRYAALGATRIVVKDGPNPILTCEDGTLATHAPVRATTVVDTTAAGDSFNAGFLAADCAGLPLATAIATGARLAAAVIAARGALVPEAAAAAGLGRAPALVPPA